MQDAINEYYQNAFSPEILVALQVTDQTKLFAEIISKHLSAGGDKTETISFTAQRFQANLQFIEKNLSDAITATKTSLRHTLFIDGIDIRPASVPYEEYLDCIKGLANAMWSLNNDFFATIKDVGCQPRIVLLIRPDILESLGLQNTNTKIRDNSVVLDWQTTYPQFRHSEIFAAIDRLLSAQQDEIYALGQCWDFYFPFNSPTEQENQSGPTSFISFLRFSLNRPRDIIVMMDIVKTLKVINKDETPVKLPDFDNAEFRKRYAAYLLGEVKDQISFYHTKEEYESFLKFFEFLYGKPAFSYEEYNKAYEMLIRYLKDTKHKTPAFFESANQFLQYLFDLNVLAYIEQMDDGKGHIHWCYRERNYANISPKIKTGERYVVHYGLAKALNLGQPIRWI